MSRRDGSGGALKQTGPTAESSLWYKDAVIYELHVRAYSDRNADGVGDFRGLAERLDYLQDLGVTALWLLPFHPSPLRDDGYDISDYTGVNPAYGTPRDVRRLVREAHVRGLRVITEMVCNHTSDQHPWFQRARRAPAGSVARNFYVWSDTPDRYADARIIFQDFEQSNWTWDPVVEAYFWHRFFSHQPDLNYDNPRVREAVFRTMDFWLQLGVDGFRLDAVPYLYEREGTNCENLPETHAFLKSLRRHVDQRFAGTMLLAEANQWPEHAAAYFGDGDECHMAFHFPLMPRMFMALQMEDRFPILDILAQTPLIPENCQWALFLRNHDELTLEMVTDEERDYMYRVYAQDPEARINLGIRRRLAPLLGNDRRKIELMNALLFSLPGAPVIYYGDEIGMGDNIYLGDRDGVRTPMQWSADRNAGFSQANPQRLYLPVILDPEYHYETVNVQTQQGNPHSLLWWMKRLIALRKRYRAFGRGSLEFLYPENRKVLAFLRRYQEETVLVVANLSRFVQYVELNLEPFQGGVPVELFGQTEFPPIRQEPYFLTLGPHAFYWFSVEPQRVAPAPLGGRVTRERIPALVVARTDGHPLRQLLHGKEKAVLEIAILAHLQVLGWFGGKERRLRTGRILEAIPIPREAELGYITLVEVEYLEEEPELYLLPLAFADADRAGQLLEETPEAAVAWVQRRGARREGLVYDALADPAFCKALLRSMAGRRRLKGERGELTASLTGLFRAGAPPVMEPLEPVTWKTGESETSVIYDDRLILKLFRRPEVGANPGVEIARFLAGKGFPHTPPLAGVLTYRESGGETMDLGLLQGFVPIEGDGWRWTLDALGRYLEQSLASAILQPVAGGATKFDTEAGAAAGIDPAGPPLSAPALLDAATAGPTALARDLLGGYLEIVRLLGRRTAELHMALSAGEGDPDFAPEPFTSHYQRSLYQSLRGLAGRTFRTLRMESAALPEGVRTEAQRLLGLERMVLEEFQPLLGPKIVARRIRCHGDLRLSKVLYTGSDFVFADFQGERHRPLGERRMKRSPLLDVAGMLHSFQEASWTPLFDQASGVAVRLEDHPAAELWLGRWRRWVCAAFLEGYLAAAGTGLVPPTRRDLEVLLEAFLLERALAEVDTALTFAPEQAGLAIRCLLDLVHSAP